MDGFMAKFDYAEFGYDVGSFDQLVFHAKKYTKEQAVVMVLLINQGATHFLYG